MKKKIFLGLILLLAFFLRFYHLGSYPPLNADEAAIGYNAWSLIKTGRDEHGEVWPLHFKSFGDYKPGGYFYIVLPFVKFFGLNEWSVRAPAAFLGVATVYLVYLLARLIWRDEILGLFWAFSLAVSPWHLQFSRGGWESNTALFFLTLGVYFFFAGLKRGKDNFTINITFSLLSSLAAMYIYHSARLVVPALGLGLVIFNWHLFWQRRKQMVFLLAAAFLLLVPLMVSFLRGGAEARFSGVGLFADPGPIWRANELINQHRHVTVARIFHNKPVLYSILFADKYFSHFSGNFLFIDGDSVPRSKIPDMGELYLFEVVFLAIGMVGWLRMKMNDKYLPWLWLGVAPLASALTFQAPSALRALPLVVPLTFFVALGLRAIWEFSAQNLPRLTPYFLRSVVIIAYLWGVWGWWNQYFIHYLKRYPAAWPDFRPVAQWLKQNQAKYQRICIAGKFDQPYILTLFYLQYPPQKAQQELHLTPRDKFGFSTVTHFGKYWFGDCNKLTAKHFDAILGK